MIRLPPPTPTASTDLSQIVSATKPLTRVGGSALVIGDRWYSSANEDSFFWNGTFWLSVHQRAHTLNLGGQSSGGDTNALLESAEGTDIVIQGARVAGASAEGISALTAAENYWTFRASRRVGGSSEPIPDVPIISMQNRDYALFANIWLTAAPFSVYQAVAGGGTTDNDLTFTKARGLGLEWTKVGTPSTVFFSYTFFYREIAP